MSNNFEQDFMKNVHTNATQISTPMQLNQSNNKSLIVVIILSIVVLIEAIAIVVLAFLLRPYDYDEETITSDEEAIVYDESGALWLICESDQNTYAFYPDSTYGKYDSEFEELLDNGAYSVVDEGKIRISSLDRDDDMSIEFSIDLNDNTLYDGTSQYTCVDGASYESYEE